MKECVTHISDSELDCEPSLDEVDCFKYLFEIFFKNIKNLI